jgi:hypothetical protein
MTESFSLRPPLIACWLIDLFATPEQAESILGDLLEEFSNLVSKSGVASARRWYWWQSVRTIAHLFGAEFRGGPPWAIASVVVGFLFLQSFFVGFFEWAMLANFRTQNVFTSPQVPFYFLSMRNGLLVWDLVVSLSIGFIVSAAAKGREMVTVISLGLSLGFWGTVLFLVWSASHHYVLQLPILMTFAASILIVLAGGMVRQIRVASARRATPD